MRSPLSADPGTTIPPWFPWEGDAREQLAALARLGPNFEPSELGRVARHPWHDDDYCRALPGERPGEPEPDGSYAIARRLMTEYEFADPGRVRAYYRDGAELLGRDMLLEIRWYAVRVRAGVRVTRVWEDEEREVDGRRARVWGWAYQTLEGHLERGQMDYQLWKWLDSGEVEFRIHAVSQRAPVAHPVLRLGFRVVGRHEQVAFARKCGERLEGLVRESLERGPGAEPDSARVGHVRISHEGG